MADAPPGGASVAGTSTPSRPLRQRATRRSGCAQRPARTRRHIADEIGRPRGWPIDEEPARGGDLHDVGPYPLASRGGVYTALRDPSHGKALASSDATPAHSGLQDWRPYSAPTTLKLLLTKTWCGQLTAIMWTLYSPLLRSTTRLTVPPG